MNKDTQQGSDRGSTQRGLMAWMLFPLALFPLAALLSYDWSAIPALNAPPSPSHNWIGALGDGFAYYGYMVFGLAIWIVPLVCVVAAVCVIRGRRMRPGRREAWFAVFLVASSCLVQVLGAHVGGIRAAAEKANAANAGGAIGYLLMTRALTPLLSDFGSAVLAVVCMAAALVGAVGARNLAAFFAFLFRWALARPDASRVPDAPDAARVPEPGDASDDDGPLAAVRRAKEEARRQREEEKARARAEKLAAKEAKRAAARGEEAEKKEKAGGGAEADDKGPYVLPPISLLDPLKKASADHGDVEEMARKLIDTLKIFGIDAELAYTVQGPVVTKYALALAPGIRYSAVTNISDNLMGALHAKSLRIEAPIPGEDAIGVEVPNRAPVGISFREIVESQVWRGFRGELPLLFGKDAAGKELVADLASMPHLLVAGATGQGKSVCLNSLINGLLMTKTPDELRLIMVDPKSVEFTSYAALPHLIVPIITENQKVVVSLKWAVVEMERRLKLFARARVRNIYDFNHRPSLTQTDMFGADTDVSGDAPKTVPYIVIIIDEVADLMSQCSKEVSPHIARLTAKARAAGIHLVLATQRPDARIITGAIKANIPGRVAFKTATGIDSRTILDAGGAENLIGRGDMLFKSKDGLLVRAQGAWISDPEIGRIVAFIEQHSTVQFDPKFAKRLESIKEEEEDPLADPEADAEAAKAAAAEARAQVKADAAADDFKQALEVVINTNRASTSHFQRQLGWGYNHAAKILDMLTARGVVAPLKGMGSRQIVMSQEDLVAMFNEDSPAPAGDDGSDGGAADETDAAAPDDGDELFAGDEFNSNERERT